MLFGITGVFGREPGGIVATSEVCWLMLQGYFTADEAAVYLVSELTRFQYNTSANDSLAMRHQIHWLYRLKKPSGFPIFWYSTVSSGSGGRSGVSLVAWIAAGPLCCCCFETQRWTAAAAPDCSLLLTLQPAAAAAAEWRNKLEPAAAARLLGKRP